MLASSDWIVEQLAAALAWDGKPDVRWLDHFWTDMTAGATRVDAWPAVTAVLRGGRLANARALQAFSRIGAVWSESAAMSPACCATSPP
jgi:hypothetical protein